MLRVMAAEYIDVVIVGAGLSGIGAAWHLQDKCPDRTYLILEERESIGGTWDLFRYPGIRSDSDMYTLGYNFKPWKEGKAIADGPSILTYIRETASEAGIDQNIRYQHAMTAARWSSDDAAWTIEIMDTASDEIVTMRCGFLLMCAGYYNYEHGYLPKFKGYENFKGEVVHPQHWPEDLDHTDKSVVVIGSGATAATLVPAMAGTASKVTIVQRSPSYYYTVPRREILFRPLRWLFPTRTAARLLRKRNVVMQYRIYRACRRWPNLMRRWLLRNVRKAIGPDVDMRHFTPRYAPWDERLCVLPEDDLFEALRSGKADIVTDQVDRFTPSGLRLASGKEIDADIIVTATGFNLRVFGDVSLSVDGEPCHPRERMIYKGVLVEGVPNLAAIFGYINFSWTAKVDLAGRWLCRLFAHMDETGKKVAVAHGSKGEALDASIMSSLDSGYVRRGGDALPRQGTSVPWRVAHDYYEDRKTLLKAPIDDGTLELA